MISYAIRFDTRASKPGGIFTQANLLEGELVSGRRLGRYELLLPIARGGMGAVWAARLQGKRGFHKLVAVKTLLAGLSDDPEFERMFLDEAKCASQVHHPHVVEILDLGEENDVLYLVMEWIDGEPLQTLIRAAAKANELVPLPLTLRILGQVCRGLHAAHELEDENGRPLGLVHRDVSPQNILVTFGGVAKLVDFGIAKSTQSAQAGLTAPGQVKGKASYMSPEQVKLQAIDRRTDLFAIGTVLYFMSTGHHPFRREHDALTMAAVADPAPVRPPSELVPNYPKALERVVLRALEKDPRKRWSTASELADAIEEVLPPLRRARGDEPIAEFVRTRLSERRTKRRESIKEAMEAIDGMPVSMASIPDRVSTPHPDDVKTVVPTLPVLPSNEHTTGKTGQPLTSSIRKEPSRSGWYVGAALAGLGVLTFLAAALYVMLASPTPPASISAAVPPASSIPPTPPPSSERADAARP